MEPDEPQPLRLSRTVTIEEAIRRLLDEAGARWEELSHEPIHNSEEAAAARGRPLEMGAKSILLKVDGELGVFVMSAATSIRSRLLRRNLGLRRSRFLTTEELLARTGLVPGTVPPFGPPILPFPLFVDLALLERTAIAFTPGVATRSIILATEDYRRIARPRLERFAE